MTREERGEEKDEGSTRIIIKDIWTITRWAWKQGREVKRGGEKRSKIVLEQKFLKS